jgi:hypothetical protein
MCRVLYILLDLRLELSSSSAIRKNVALAIKDKSRTSRTEKIKELPNDNEELLKVKK